MLRTKKLRSSGTSNLKGGNPSVRMSQAHWIPVVAGILVKGGLVLVGQRPDSQSLGGVWEFPGGKIERGEQPQAALIRELREELGIEVLEVSPVQMVQTHSYGYTNILILFYLVRYWRGEVQPRHHTSLEWVTPQELLSRPIPEANLHIIGDLYRILGVSQ
ncbi:MAG: (deoxy)nucleoside triphosphate pyrophosphohydrolase [Bdellovibrionaceae bacterium]|nr:(deoxy)nucleoside triphosphate pyrophosphohydrolase [Pseudobdellovibrionaceae bacterium]MDW8190464.1 (deoxy)nucleoside triphosphate pyrophosphohydrolase [Pseudobdellovibrionaceae bacterium]